MPLRLSIPHAGQAVCISSSYQPCIADSFFYSVREQSIFDYSDGLLLALILSLGLAIIIAEWQHRALSSFLQESLRSDKSALLLLGIVSLVCVRYYFARGALHWSGDAAQHIAYVEITARELALFNFPTWTFAIGNGSPYLQNYGSLFFYLAGLFTLAVQDLNLGIKLCLVFAHVLSGLGMFLFIRHLTHSRRAGFFAGLAFVLSFWHVQQVLIMGRLPLALFYGLLPFAFWAIEMLARSGYRIRAASIGAIALASLFFYPPRLRYLRSTLGLVLRRRALVELAQNRRLERAILQCSSPARWRRHT